MRRVLISLKYELIDYIETNYPDMQTGFLTFASFGNTAALNCDYIGLEEESATTDAINAIHKEGKKVLVWTANEERIVSLAKPVKKGILRLIFSRFFVSRCCSSCRWPSVMAYLQFREKLPVLLNLQWIFTFVMIIYLFNSSMDSSAKLTWMLSYRHLPFPGAAMLLWTQANIGHRMETEMVKSR